MLVKILVALICFIYFPGYCQDFGYDGNIGPNHWAEKYSKCVGKHQSPIDIEEDNVKIIKFPPLKFDNFNSNLKEVKILNNGHTVVLSISKGKLPVINGGPLRENYKFTQLHFHWGINDTEGSESLINNHSFPMELHMVFYSEKYNNFNDAANQADGLTVLSFLYQATNGENRNYKQFENNLPKVYNLSSYTAIKNFVSLTEFTINNKNVYFTYKGSLTTPPCSEVVTWIEFKNTIPLSHEQIQAFRLLAGQGGQLTHNFRPVQLLYDRVIYMNSPSDIFRIDNTFMIINALVSLIYCNITK